MQRNIKKKAKALLHKRLNYLEIASMCMLKKREAGFNEAVNTS